MAKSEKVRSVIFYRGTSPEPSQLLSLVAVGDICLGGRLTGALIPRGTHSAFQLCKDVIKDNDILFANLEMVISDDTRMIAKPNSDMLAPVETAFCIVDAGFNILNLANNHILDYGSGAAEETIVFLSKNGIGYCGYGRNRDEAWAPRILTTKGQRLGFLGITDNWRQGAGKNCSGAAICNQRRAFKLVNDLRKRVDHVIISYHADLEFADYPDPDRIRFARRLVENGATIILQHHPHVPQGIEVFSKGLIAYSLGNFVFDVDGDEYLKYGSEFCKITFALKILMDKAGIVKAEIFPIGIDDIGLPSLLAGERGQEVLNHIQTVSDGLKSEKILWENWFCVCRKYLKRETKWLLHSFYRKGPSSAVKRLLHLARITEPRRWIKGCLIYIFHKAHMLRNGL